MLQVVTAMLPLPPSAFAFLTAFQHDQYFHGFHRFLTIHGADTTS